MDDNFSVRYDLARELTPQEERDILEFIDPYVSYLEYDMITKRLRGFGIYRHLRNKFFWAQVAALGNDHDDYDDSNLS